MKKLLLSLTILLTVYGCKVYDKGTPGKEIPGQYILFMKDAFGAPLINFAKDDTDRLKQSDNLEPQRVVLISKLEKYLKEKGIKVKKKNVFVDVSVGAVLNISPAKVEILIADKVNVDTVVQDVNVQINPIQQGDPTQSNDPMQQWLSPPVSEINPIQQDDSIQNRYDIDAIEHMTKAIKIAGGPVSGTGKSTVIWFLDSGIDTDNPSLNVDARLGKSFITGASMDDDFGHGTFCAGVAAGKPVGSLPGLPQIHIGISEGATVVPVKVLDRTGAGTWSTVILGLNHVARNVRTGDVVNLSLGSYDAANPNCHYPGLRKAISRLGVRGAFVTLSAGNDRADANCNRPGCISANRVFTASSINANLTCADYANFGAPPVDFVTVGTRVFSLWDNGGFRMASGTSVSSAILAGIIHARGSAPAQGGTVNCMGNAYRIAVR